MTAAAEDKAVKKEPGSVVNTHTTHHSYKFKGHSAVFISFFLFPANCWERPRGFSSNVCQLVSQQPAACNRQIKQCLSCEWYLHQKVHQGLRGGEQVSKTVSFFFSFPLLVLLEEGKVLQKSTLFISALSKMWKLSYSCLRAKSQSSHLVILSSAAHMERRKWEWMGLLWQSAAAVRTAVYSWPDQFYRKDTASLSRFKVQSLPLARGEKANSTVWGEGLLCVDSNKLLSRTLHRLVLMKLIWHEKQHGCTLAS